MLNSERIQVAQVAVTAETNPQPTLPTGKLITPPQSQLGRFASFINNLTKPHAKLVRDLPELDILRSDDIRQWLQNRDSYETVMEIGFAPSHNPIDHM